MDGSTRSSHGNAYFTGFGKAQAHRLLRHADRAPHPGRDRGGARPRARPTFARGHIPRLLAVRFALALLLLGVLGWL
jgi:STE24 endopeptidase